MALFMAFDAPGSEKWAPILLPLGLAAWPIVAALDIGLAPITLTGIILYNSIKKKRSQPAIAEAERQYNAYVQQEVERNGYLWRDDPANPE